MEEIFTKIQNAENITENIKDYFKEKFDEKDKWCYAYKKHLPCLKIKTTSRIESLNALIKAEIKASSSLIELFYRMINITQHSLNINYSDMDLLNASLLASQNENVVIKKVKNLISPYALDQTITNLFKAFNYQVKLYRGTFTINSDSFDIKIEKDKLECNCAYYKTMGIPCPDLLAICLKYPEINIEEFYRARWLKNHSSIELHDESIIDFCKNFLAKVNEESREERKDIGEDNNNNERVSEEENAEEGEKEEENSDYNEIPDDGEEKEEEEEKNDNRILNSQSNKN